MVASPAEFGFSAEYVGDHPAYDDFDDYLRIEFGESDPGWQPRFGKANWFDPDANRYDYMYLLHGNVPEAESQDDAENKVRQLLDRFERRLKSAGPKVERALPKPLVRVWKWRT